MTHISALDNGCVYIELNDGRKGEVNITHFMVSPFFKALESPKYFSKVSIFFTGIRWPDGLDLGQDTLAANLQPCSADRKAG